MKHFNLFLIALGIAFLSACSPYDSVYTDELDATITVYDTLADFSKMKNYVLRDSVGLVHNDWLTDAQVNAFYAAGGSSEKIKAMVKAKFDALGYTEVQDLADADFAVNMTVFAIEYTSYYYYYPGWWWSYPGYWPPYWGPYKKSTADVNYYPWYPYYPSYTYYSSYEGLLLVEMADAKTITDTDPEVRFIWEAGIQGSLTSDKSYNQERIQRGLDKAFEQSPYLGIN